MIRRARSQRERPIRASSQCVCLPILCGCIAAAGLFGCSSERPESVESKPGSVVIAPEPPDTSDCPPAYPLVAPTADVGRDRSGSEVVIARISGRRVIFAADPDARRIAAIDPDARKELGATDVNGAPSQLVIGKDGRLYAALRDKSAIAILEATGSPDGSLRVVGSFTTAAEPVGLALTADGRTLLVTSGISHRLEGFAVERRTRTFSVSLPREPRAIVLSADGKTAFVSHMVGSLVSAVDIADINSIDNLSNFDGEIPTRRVSAISMRGNDFTPPPMEGCGALDPDPKTEESPRIAVQGFALVRVDGRILAPQSLARPGDPRIRSDGYGHAVGDLPSQVGDVASIDEASKKPSWASIHLPAIDVAAYIKRHKDCILPRAAAADPAQGSVLLACADTGATLEIDPAAPDPARAVRRRFPATLGSTGVAIDSAEREAFVWSSMGRALDILSLGEPSRDRLRDARGKRAASVALEPLSDREVIDEGRLLFHTSGDRRIAADGRACASCHPDARDDGLVWPTPEGPRQPPMLAGRLRETAPYSWAGGHATLKDHLAVTMKRLHGKGLDARLIDALTAYLLALEGPPRAAVSSIEAPQIARGRELFHSADVGCSSCHREETAFTDGSLHDVSSAASSDRFSVFDTPSLRFVGGTGPYFHDGRYATLGDLLAGTRKTMGMTTNLTVGDLSALQKYLESL